MFTEISELSDFEQIVSRKAVVLFTNPTNCRPCRTLAPHFKKAAEIVEELPFVYVNVENAEQLMHLYVIQSVPTIYMFEQGRAVRRMTGRTVIALVKEARE